MKTCGTAKSANSIIQLALSLPLITPLFSLKHITLTQFRNYSFADFSFPGRITGFCGKNGIGKTNILDGIYYLCFTKSYSGRPDSGSVKSGFNGFRIQGELHRLGSDHTVVCILRESGKKELLIDDESYSRFSSHIGKFPAVMICPDDINLISGSSEARRRFLDTILSQISIPYLENLIRYNKIMVERNSLLKKIADGQVYDEILLDILDQQLSETGEFIYSERIQFLQTFIPETTRFYELIAGRIEETSVNYKSIPAGHSYRELLRQSRARDIAMQRTNIGIHRDDLEFFLGDQPFKSIASQGQKKSLLFALKLAEFNTLKKKNGFSPLLLLDDIFEKLDEKRMMNLLHWVCEENEGQVFLTDTHKQRLQEIMEKLSVPYQLIELE